MLSKHITLALCVAVFTQPVWAQETVELPVTTEAELQALVDGPIFNPQAAVVGEGLDPDLVNTESLFVIEGGFQKPAGEWTAADSRACEASGGVELPISAGRIACFAL